MPGGWQTRRFPTRAAEAAGYAARQVRYQAAALSQVRVARPSHHPVPSARGIPQGLPAAPGTIRLQRNVRAIDRGRLNGDPIFRFPNSQTVEVKK